VNEIGLANSSVALEAFNEGLHFVFVADDTKLDQGGAVVRALLQIAFFFVVASTILCKRDSLLVERF